MTEGYSLSDIASVADKGDGFGGGSWWIIVLFLFFFVGMGNNYGNGSGVMDNYTIASDFSQLLNRTNQIGDALGNGIADATFALNNALNANNMSTMQGFNTIQQAMANDALSSQKCCCETQRQMERGFAETNYNMATQNCATNNAIQSSARDIIDNQNANTQRIVDLFTTNEMQNLRDELQNARFTLSQQAQTNSIVNRLNPTPIPAYNAPSPYGCCYQCN